MAWYGFMEIWRLATCGQAWYALHDTWLTESVRGKLKLISELLCIKHHYLKLDLFKADEVSVIIDFLCTTWYDDVFSSIVLQNFY